MLAIEAGDREAGLKAAERLCIRGSNNARKINQDSWLYAEKKLVEEQWSPEQIAGRFAMEGLEFISHETLYQCILLDKKAGGNLYTHLRSRKKRRKRYGSIRPTRGCIPNRVDIEKRPAIVDSRKRTGDWEGDTIIGSHDGGAVIVSMVERKSRFTVLAKTENKTTKAVIEGINQHMLPIAELVLTITLDNGKEFSSHETMAAMLNTNVYFAKPYQSWQRGLNENTNGLVRQYFPKKIPFDSITNSDLQNVADKLNNRPRKCLGFRTPFEVFNKACEKKGIALRI